MAKEENQVAPGLKMWMKPKSADVIKSAAQLTANYSIHRKRMPRNSSSSMNAGMIAAVISACSSWLSSPSPTRL